MSRFFVLSLALLATMSSLCSAQWTTRSLHPVGATYSGAYGIGQGEACGVVRLGGGSQAALWNVGDGLYTDLHPNGAISSEAWAVSNGVQVGQTTNSIGSLEGSFWTGNAGSWTSLGPDTYGISTDGTHQVGYVWIYPKRHAALWTNGGSMVDLHPIEVGDSIAYAVAGGVQAGSVSREGIHGLYACLWQGSRQTLQILHPSEADGSEAYGTDGVQQVGVAWVGGVANASLWSGDEASWVNLHPLGADVSLAWGVGGGYQVGFVQTAGQDRASLWEGDAESYVDLAQFLPPVFTGGNSYAWGVWSDGDNLYVAGEATNVLTGQTEAMLWILDENQPPVAVAGADQTVFADSGPNSPDYGTAAFGLDGNGSYDPDGDQLTYEWSDANGVISNDPWVGQTRTVGTYEFTLKVTDPDGLSDSDTVTITVQFENRPPIANAGPDQTVTVPHDGDPNTWVANFSLDGTASYDPDGDTLTYTWKYGTSTIASTPLVSQTTQRGTYLYTLRVSEPSGAFTEDQVTVTVLPEPNLPPVANAGLDLTVYLPKGWTRIPVILDGRASFDPDGDAINGFWGAPNSNGGMFYDYHLGVGTHTIHFYVRDSYSAMSSDSVTVTVLPALQGGNPDGPIAIKDSYDSVYDVPFTFAPLENDSHTQGLPIQFHAFQWTYGGSFVHLGNGACRFTPWAGNKGWGQAVYIIRDDLGRTSVGMIQIKLKKP